jgi:site-specific DNA-methyltransferase (adenine-specific)
MSALPRRVVLVGDALRHLEQLPPSTVDMVLTSPPYFRLRNYQTTGQLGMEDHVEQWVSAVREVLAEVARLLVPTGTVWLNLGDTYSVDKQQGAPKKSLLCGPERLMLALLADGWTIRNKIIWAKTNPMPTSVRDRLAATHELVLLLARQRNYFFDLDAIRQPMVSRPARHHTPPRASLPEDWRGPNSDGAEGLARMKLAGRVGHPLGKNPGDVWRFATSGYRGGHYATFSRRLAERTVRAGCPPRRCTVCRTPWRQCATRALGRTAARGPLEPSCSCGGASELGIVLDPFMGAGTTALVAEALGRDWLGVELNPTFAALAGQRVAAARPPNQREPPLTSAA